MLSFFKCGARHVARICLAVRAYLSDAVQRDPCACTCACTYVCACAQLNAAKVSCLGALERRSDSAYCSAVRLLECLVYIFSFTPVEQRGASRLRCTCARAAFLPSVS